jgi:hypothetical protein
MKSSIIRKLLGGLSFTTALFVFEACYGPPQDFGADVFVEGLVKSKKTGQPIKGIKVSVTNNPQYQFTSEDGSFSFYTEYADSCNIRFEDTDADQNGAYTNKDTTLINLTNHIYLNILLVEK